MLEKLKILVVDDDQGLRDLFNRILAKDHEIFTAANGAEALTLAKEHTFHLAFIDMRMPGLNGSEVFAELRKIQPEIKGIIMTGYSDKDLRLEAFFAGTERYINKPFEIADIRKMVADEFDLQKERASK